MHFFETNVDYSLFDAGGDTSLCTYAIEGLLSLLPEFADYGHGSHLQANASGGDRSPESHRPCMPTAGR